jgi:hypothetical protein
MKTIKQQSLLLIAGILLGLYSRKSLAVSTAIPVKEAWFFDFSQLRPSIEIPLQDKPATITLPLKKMQLRASRSQSDVRVEPFAFLLRKDESQVNSIAKKFAKRGRASMLSDYLWSNIDTSELLRPGSDSRSVYLSKQAFQFIDKEKFGTRFENLHHNLAIKTPELRRDKNLLEELMNQISPYLSESQLAVIGRKLEHANNINVDRDFLPEFAKKMVKRFTIYRGPNCFHAALAFQDSRYTDSFSYNVKEEKGYHRAMINYDELWRTLKSEFYEVDASKATLKYGDIITFFEVPDRLPGAVDYRWIRHTATYLFNGYTFSKGSKSPNTPYTVKTMKEEWDTWKAYVSIMAVKVFRKSGKNVNSAPANDLNDWLN